MILPLIVAVRRQIFINTCGRLEVPEVGEIKGTVFLFINRSAFKAYKNFLNVHQNYLNINSFLITWTNINCSYVAYPLANS